ncbi:hypothetical protein CALCODRAFT_130235 [Calocera cornea HHB12733]|uniref:Uncharacterized protein n=1 Tax=Calocera cornea HHB12733 TaxID=1353952 RepID=A0A165IAH1_9BASI|nr:hypothetical protein CALCODRAFT_130235 [Calocera cornea HHB12733]
MNLSCTFCRPRRSSLIMLQIILSCHDDDSNTTVPLYTVNLPSSDTRESSVEPDNDDHSPSVPRSPSEMSVTRRQQEHGSKSPSQPTGQAPPDPVMRQFYEVRDELNALPVQAESVRSDSTQTQANFLGERKLRSKRAVMTQKAPARPPVDYKMTRFKDITYNGRHSLKFEHKHHSSSDVPPALTVVGQVRETLLKHWVLAIIMAVAAGWIIGRIF